MSEKRYTFRDRNFVVRVAGAISTLEDLLWFEELHYRSHFDVKEIDDFRIAVTGHGVVQDMTESMAAQYIVWLTDIVSS